MIETIADSECLIIQGTHCPFCNKRAFLLENLDSNGWDPSEFWQTFPPTAATRASSPMTLECLLLGTLRLHWEVGNTLGSNPIFVKSSFENTKLVMCNMSLVKWENSI